MKYIKRFLTVVSISIFCLFETVFAEAYLEGDEAANAKSLLDGLDSSVIMANWHKIVFLIVGILCVIGLIISNIRWFIKKRNKK